MLLRDVRIHPSVPRRAPQRVLHGLRAGARGPGRQRRGRAGRGWGPALLSRTPLGAGNGAHGNKSLCLGASNTAGGTRFFLGVVLTLEDPGALLGSGLPVALREAVT